MFALAVFHNIFDTGFDSRLIKRLTYFITSCGSYIIKLLMMLLLGKQEFCLTLLSGCWLLLEVHCYAWWDHYRWHLGWKLHSRFQNVFISHFLYHCKSIWTIISPFYFYTLSPILHSISLFLLISSHYFSSTRCFQLWSKNMSQLIFEKDLKHIWNKVLYFEVNWSLAETNTFPTIFAIKSF